MMSTLYQIQGYTEVDYRVIYVIEDEFREIMRDVYMATYTTSRPPYFEDILSELIDMGTFAKVFLTHAYEEPDKYQLTREMIDEKYKLIVLQGETEIHAISLMNYAGTHFCELFENDVYTFLNDNNYCFLERERNYQSHAESSIRNPPIVAVW